MTVEPTVRKNNADMLLEIEKNLQQYLRPVKPNPDFIQRVENRLVNTPQINIEQKSELGFVLVIMLTLITMVPFFWVMWRYIIKKLL